MPPGWATWNHITKIDPDKSLRKQDAYSAIAETGTDAIIIGGTTGITEERVRPLLDVFASTEIPVYIEPTYRPTIQDHATVDGYLIPLVLNAGDTTWITGAHMEWVRSTDTIDWTHTFPEAYIVLNPVSAVATYTQATCDLTAVDVAAYAEVAEQLLGQDIVYLESSGTLSDPAIVAAARDALSTATLFYGGGIHDYDSAYEMATVADTVVVGDLLHEKGIDAVRETVNGVDDARNE
ncbi:phosphoglycerol geranylgeranyltransferase [Haladaptatus caseinilyticus]|uniref:phosphoglycerol geranylgeranyltransferase n=1 Tax=Haladaptatus caseinilyticus TaxID=2993314 RepID=UPI00224A8FA5|nr:putative phosphoglycerol geranylgeranyltransferase [Haladaptatus caseinilyticus]